MRKRNFTILVIPNGQGKTYRFNTDSIVLTSIAVFCFVFVAATAFFSYDYFGEQMDKRELTALQTENQFLNGKLGEMESTISGLRDEYASIVDKEKVIRSMFNLPEIDDQQRQLGIGGPDLIDLTAKSVSERLAYDVELDVDELVRLSSFETRQYKDIYEVLLNERDRLDHTPSIMPCEGYLTRGYGLMTHPISGFKQMHAGLDFANRTGTPIYSTAAGKVSYVGNRGRLGKTVEINHGNGLKTIYGHLSKSNVKRGQSIVRGDKIGEMGSTGYSTGTHLHYAITFNGQSVNPNKYILTSTY
jgi:murein DD-endopeptidase MepM/ murein hydrolase activator NlpD